MQVPPPVVTRLPNQIPRSAVTHPNRTRMVAGTVLIADRDPDTREILALALSRAGLRPLVAADGPSALATLELEPVKLVIAELYLACAHERCLLRALKRHPAHRDVLVIAYSSRVAAADREWAHRQRCDVFLPKPTSIVDVVEHVRALLGHDAEHAALTTES